MLKGFDKKHWATKVSELFDPETLRIVFSMEETERTSYKKIKQAVLIQYTQEGNRQRFINYSPAKKQRFIEYVANLQRLFTSWMKSPDIDQSYASLSDLIIIDSILNTVDPKIYSYLIEQKPTTLAAFVRLCSNFCEAHGISIIAKPKFQNLQSRFSQTVVQPVKQNNSKSAKQSRSHTASLVIMVSWRGITNTDTGVLYSPC